MALDVRGRVLGAGLSEPCGGPARIRTGDRQVSRTWGYEPAALSVLQPEENLAELRALQESRSRNSILNVLWLSSASSQGQELLENIFSG